MALIVIRHGESELLEKYKKLKEIGISSKPENVEQFKTIEKIYQLYRNSSLSKKGKQEILSSANQLMAQGFPISRAFISPTKRTQETYDIISEMFARQKIPFPCYKIDPRISIIESGVLHGIRGTETDDEITNFFNEKNQNGLTGKEFAHSYLSGETILQATQRIYNFLDDTRGIWKRKNMLIITHKSTMRVIRTYFEHDIDNKSFFECEPSNGGILIYGKEFKGKLSPKEKFSIKFRNFISKISTQKSKELKEFFNKLAKRGIERLDNNKSSNGISLEDDI